MKTFSESTLLPFLKTNLSRNGFETPTPIQAAAIEPALAGNDLLATAETGTGKTLAFVLPIIQSLTGNPAPTGVRAIILSPTRELALQINETFLKMAVGSGLTSSVVVGGLSESTQLRAIRKGAQVLIATAGRLHDFLSRGLLKLSGVKILVLDEADRMLDMGFLPTIERIMAALPAQRQTLFFSATIESSVKHLVDAHLPRAVRIELGSSTKPTGQVDLRFYEVEQDRKLGLLHSLMQEEQGSFLVFARTKHGADRLARRLADNGVKTAAIHGDRSQNQRNQALRGFQEGYYRVLVATDVAARGIHVDNIAHVVNYDLPQVPEDFIHRVGRTGRAGTRGTASTFGTRLERSTVAHMERTLAIRLTRYTESGEAAPVEAGDSQAARPRQWRSFGPSRRSGRTHARRSA
ncbi:MAG TPA: DEAD/DEAH box helicase [Bryobacteraceae bacterium]|nr:DEAD/DEAH box helicase [Bryobacteraceae bacterium]